MMSYVLFMIEVGWLIFFFFSNFCSTQKIVLDQRYTSDGGRHLSHQSLVKTWFGKKVSQRELIRPTHKKVQWGMDGRAGAHAYVHA